VRYSRGRRGRRPQRTPIAVLLPSPLLGRCFKYVSVSRGNSPREERRLPKTSSSALALLCPFPDRRFSRFASKPRAPPNLFLLSSFPPEIAGINPSPLPRFRDRDVARISSSATGSSASLKLSRHSAANFRSEFDSKVKTADGRTRTRASIVIDHRKPARGKKTLMTRATRPSSSHVIREFGTSR